MTAPESSNDRRPGVEEPEGLDEAGTSLLADYPLDTVFVRAEQRTVNEVVGRIKADRYVLDPEFQRDFVWSLHKQSRLIESCLMRIPLPVFYVAEGEDGRIVVVDGLQRLTTFYRYLTGAFAVVGVAGESGDPTNLEGKRFSDLPIKLQERLEDTQLTLYILDAKAPDRAKLDIFERVNSGEPLTRQQMRNSLFCGPATRLLREAAESPVFIAATGGSLNRKTMRDREAINRFCGFYHLGVDAYHGDMDAFLAQALESLNQATEERRQQVLNAFRNAMAINQAVFGEHAFRKSALTLTGGDGTPSYRSVINMSLFDVLSVLLADVAPGRAEERRSAIRQSVGKLLEDEAFLGTITYSTNSTKPVNARFQMMTDALRDVLSD